MNIGKNKSAGGIEKLMKNDEDILKKVTELCDRMGTIEKDNKKVLMTALQGYDRLQEEIKALKYGIISIVDEVENLASAISPKLDEGIKKGTDMSMRNIYSQLDKYGIEQIKVSIGDEFDPQIHKCGSESDENDGVVKQIIKKGYRDSHTKVIMRYAEVELGKKDTK